MSITYQKTTNPIYRKLLRKVRKQRGISARKLAKEIGIDPSYISKIETGDAPPPAWDKMLAIDRVLRSPELLEAGEYALLKRALLSNGYLLDSLHQMPPNLVNEIGADKLASWKKFCFQMSAILMAAYDRRARWKDVPIKNRRDL